MNRLETAPVAPGIVPRKFLEFVLKGRSFSCAERCHRVSDFKPLRLRQSCSTNLRTPHSLPQSLSDSNVIRSDQGAHSVPD